MPVKVIQRSDVDVLWILIESLVEEEGWKLLTVYYDSRLNNHTAWLVKE